MEALLRAALIAWLRGSATLAPLINAVSEEVPFASEVPWLAIAATSASDWSTKTEPGAEISVTLELHSRADQPAADAPTLAAIDTAVRGLPAAQAGFALISVFFLHSRVEQRAPAERVTQMAYRFRLQSI